MLPGSVEPTNRSGQKCFDIAYQPQDESTLKCNMAVPFAATLPSESLHADVNHQHRLMVLSLVLVLALAE